MLDPFALVVLGVAAAGFGFVLEVLAWDSLLVAAVALAEPDDASLGVGGAFKDDQAAEAASGEVIEISGASGHSGAVELLVHYRLECGAARSWPLGRLSIRYWG